MFENMVVEKQMYVQWMDFNPTFQHPNTYFNNFNGKTNMLLDTPNILVLAIDRN